MAKILLTCEHILVFPVKYTTRSHKGAYATPLICLIPILRHGQLIVTVLRFDVSYNHSFAMLNGVKYATYRPPPLFLSHYASSRSLAPRSDSYFFYYPSSYSDKLCSSCRAREALSQFATLWLHKIYRNNNKYKFISHANCKSITQAKKDRLQTFTPSGTV